MTTSEPSFEIDTESDSDEAATARMDADLKSKARSRSSKEKSHATTLELIKKLMKERPDDHLFSILADLREVNISRKDPGRYYRTRDIVRPIGANIMSKSGLTVDETFLFPAVNNSEYGLGAQSPTRYLSTLIRKNTTAVMELGSGWSPNLFQLYLAHGATRSSRINYYGGEETTQGQICAKYLAKHDPLMRYRAFQFDFATPNVEFLIRQRGHILLFTSHAIEQVEILNPNLFEQLRAIPNPVTVVHFEPVGWQRDAELLARREADDRPFFEALGQKALSGSTDSVMENAAWWSWRLDYNKNLLPTLRKLESENAIRMVRTAYDYSGQTNVLNPSTLIHYEFVR